MLSKNKYDNYCWLTIGLFSLFRIIISAIIQPGFDESYYGLYSYHLAPGYFDHPPLVAFSAGFGRFITGITSPLTLRLGAILLFIGTLVLLYKLTSQIFNKKAGLIAVVLANLIPYFSVGLGAFVIPDNFLGFFWLASLFAFYRIIKKEDKKYFFVLGLTGGLALLSKYHAVLLIFSLFLALLLIKENRKWLKTPYPYLSFIIAIILFLPNIIWNYQNDWISYTYQFGKSAEGFKFSGLLFFQGIMVQMGYLLPWHMFILIASIVWSWKKKDRDYAWLLPVAIVPIIVFTIIGGTRKILPHWPMPGYLAAIILSAGKIKEWKAKNINRYLSITGLITIVLISLLTIQAEYGILNLRPKGDVTLDGQGWKKLGKYLTKEKLLNEDSFLFTRKWFLSGELDYALENRYPVTVFNHNSSHSFSFWVNHKNLKGQDGIFISTNRYKTDPLKKYSQYFLHIEKIHSLQTYRHGQKAKTFYIWLCKDYQGNFPFAYGASFK